MNRRFLQSSIHSKNKRSILMKAMFLHKSISLIIIVLLSSLSGNAQTCNGPLSINLEGTTTGIPLIVSVESDGTSCIEDGSITTTVTGGNPDYHYEWADVTITDSVRSNLSTGNYQLTITDSEGCFKTVDANVVALDNQNAALTTADGCGVCMMDNGNNSFFFDEQKNYIAALTDDMDNPVELGNTEVCVFVDDNVGYCEGMPVLQRSWSINPVENTNSCIKLFFTQEEFDNLANANTESRTTNELIQDEALCVTAFSGGMESCDDHMEKTIYLMSANNEVEVQLEDPVEGIWSASVCVDHFSTFTINVCDVLLPVELLYFDGKRVEAANQLEWVTVSENNSSHFELQKSLDGQNFSTIHIAQATGFSQSNTLYQFTDERVSNVVDYYRLKSVDIDGSYEFSQIIAIYQQQDFASKLYPTLFHDKLTHDINLPSSDKIKYYIVDALGKLIVTKEVETNSGYNTIDFDLAGLSPGAYYINFQVERLGYNEVAKIIKAK